MSLTSGFDREALPLPATFYRDNVERFRQFGRRRGSGLCPFHADKHPSLDIDLERGLFYCHACSAGGDIISFIMQRDGVDFKAACQSLGAWRGADTPEARLERRRAQSERERMKRAAEELKRRERDERLLARDLIHLLERDKRQLSEQFRLDSVNDARWEELVLTENLLRQELAIYSLLSFACAELRADFALQFEHRPALIREITERGWFHDDDGRRVEVLE